MSQLDYMKSKDRWAYLKLRMKDETENETVDRHFAQYSADAGDAARDEPDGVCGWHNI